MWQKYVKDILATNPDYWTRFEHYISNFAIYRKANNRVEEVMSYKRFKNIILSYFNRAKKAIIKGEAVNMQSGVGKICARRVERDFRKPKQRTIDWAKTRKQPLVFDETTQKMKYANVIYNTDDEWCRIGWHKAHRLVNEQVYEFKPSKSGNGSIGFANEFSKALITDPLLKYRYLYYPVTNYVPKNAVA